MKEIRVTGRDHHMQYQGNVTNSKKGPGTIRITHVITGSVVALR